jgi:hypothetical protein
METTGAIAEALARLAIELRDERVAHAVTAERLKRALAVLRRVEWCGSVRVEHYSGPDSYEPACPLCGGEPPNLDVTRRQAMGHAYDCPLAAALREGEP